MDIDSEVTIVKCVADVTGIRDLLNSIRISVPHILCFQPGEIIIS